jgi:hypothetical protein
MNAIVAERSTHDEGDATGFVRLNPLRLKLRALRERIKE